MNLIRKILLFIAVLMCVGVYSQDTKIIAQNVLNSTVAITIKDVNSQILGLGSGFVIGKNYIVTNVHVIEGAKSVYIKTNNSTYEFKSTGYVAIDKVNDLAILEVPALAGVSLSLSTKTPEVGEKIYVAGNPFGLAGTFSDGLISGIREFNKRKLIQISAPISPGSSGGPVVNSNSELIGISVSGIRDGQNLNFCIPTEYLIRLKQNIGSLIAFNILKKSETKNAAYTGIRSGVAIRDVKLGPLYSGSGSCVGRCIYSFSIFNNLSQPIHNIRVLFIVYDSKGIPIDSFEDTFFNSNDIFYPGFIPPKLAKKVINVGNVVNSFKVELHNKDKLAIRILNYQINYQINSE